LVRDLDFFFNPTYPIWVVLPLLLSYVHKKLAFSFLNANHGWFGKQSEEHVGFNINKII